MGTTISGFATNTHLRTPADHSELTGMCTVCTASCLGTCEIGFSAVRGCETVYPTTTDVNQFASNKQYPLDLTQFTINGQVFGAMGCPEDSYAVTYPKARIEASFGVKHPIPLLAPIVLPAMAKLDWADYFAGAAMAGVLAVVGEDVVAKDGDLELEHGKVKRSPLLKAMIGAFSQYHRGYGDIVIQANADDEHLGVLDHVVRDHGVETVEFKFGQSAKGIQGVSRLKKREDALKFKRLGYVVHPDPETPEIEAACEAGVGIVFERIGKLPLWDEAYFASRIQQLRTLGAKRFCFKTGPYAPQDLMRIMRIASDNAVDLVTFDAAGGGTGNSPLRMMNEWGIPTIELIEMIRLMAEKLSKDGKHVPQIAITGGFVMEDHLFKGLALGAPYISLIGVGRGAMAAAMSSKAVAESIKAGNIPKIYAGYGDSIESIFEGYKDMQLIYGETGSQAPAGAVGLYTYLNRLGYGLKQLMALNRKFDLTCIDRGDVIPLTKAATKVTGLKTAMKLMRDVIEE